MSVILTWQRSTPGQPQYGLATLTETYKVQNDDGSQITAAAVLVDGGLPQIGDAHPDYATMFVTARYCSETGESASALDLTYTGTLSGSLPDQKNDFSNAVQSASSSYGLDGITLSTPATIQFYAPTTSLSYISSGGPGSDVAADPTDDPVAINYTIGILSFSIGGTIAALIANYFSILITENHTATEIVVGQYWQNTSTKTKTYVPLMLNLAPGAYLQLSGTGMGYTSGDTLTITGGSGVAVIVLTATGISNSIIAWTVSSISCTTPENNVAATGGTGTGALFNIIIVT